MDAVEAAIMVVEEDEEEDFVPMRIIRTSTKNENGRVIKSKQKRFAIDTDRKKIGYVVVVRQIFSRFVSSSKRKKKKGSEISYEPEPSFHGLNTHLDDSYFLVGPENKNKISM